MNLIARMTSGSRRPQPVLSHAEGGEGAAELPSVGTPGYLLPGFARSHFARTGSSLFALILVLLLTACSKLTESNLQKIQPGMTTGEVKAILGEPTTSQTGNMLGLVSGTTYVYHTNKSDVKISFVNDKVVTTEGNFQ